MREGPLQGARTADAPFILIEDGAGGTLRFGEPVECLRAHRPGDVEAVLVRLAEAVAAGFHVAGYITYEAGYAFEPSLHRLAGDVGRPLLCFGVFREPEPFA